MGILNEIFVIKKEKEDFLGVKFKKRGKYFHLSQPPKKISPNEIKGKDVTLVHFFPELHFGRETLPKSPEEIILLQLREKIIEMGLFESVPRVAFEITDDFENQIEATYIAVNKLQVDSIISEIANLEGRLTALYAEQLAVAYLTIHETKKNILSIYLGSNKAFITLTGLGKIHFIRNIEISPNIGITASQIEETLLAAIDQSERILNLKLDGLIAYGPKRDLLPDTAIPSIEPKFKYFKNISNNMILNEPILYGSLFIPDPYNLIPKEHKMFLKHLNWARKVAYGLLFASLINYGLWFYYSPRVNHIKEEIDSLKSQISENTERIKQLLPPERKAILEQYAQLLERYEKSFRLEEFLTWLNGVTPAGVEIESLEGSPENLSNNPSPGNNFIISLTASYPGGVERAQEVLEKYFTRIAEKIDVIESRFVYDNKNSKGVLMIKGTYHGK